MFTVLTVPFYLIGGLAFGFGIIVGSFLNVVIYRLHTNRSLQGRSHCLSCGVTLEWYDLFPLFSYIVLRGRCRSCQAIITPRYFLVELITGLLFVLTLATTAEVVPVALTLAILSILVVIVVYDFYHFIIPDNLVVWLLALALAWHGYSYLVLGDVWVFVYSFVAATLASVFFAGLWAISRGRWLGLGDAKLVFPLALILGSTYTFSFVVLAFWIGAGISLLILAWQYMRYRGKPHLHFLTRPLTIKSAVPFAPFIIASFCLVYFFQIDVLAIVEQLLWYLY